MVAAGSSVDVYRGNYSSKVWKPVFFWEVCLVEPRQGYTQGEEKRN